MTALKPIENRRVRGVASERYPINAKCAHPDCDAPIDGVHHAFPRSLTKSDSYFVEIQSGGDGDEPLVELIIPHATGLCGSGTTGHHGDVEEHRAWIKLEDGEFVWYDRNLDGEILDDDGQEMMAHESPDWEEWLRVGPLSPQPGSREGKAKRKRLKGDARAQRKTISFRVPDDAERGSEVFDSLLRDCKDEMVKRGLKGDPDEITTYIALTGVMASWLQS